jgi:hypothetical protein
LKLIIEFDNVEDNLKKLMQKMDLEYQLFLVDYDENYVIKNIVFYEIVQ